MKISLIGKAALLMFMFLAIGCMTRPEGVEPVKGFDLNKYLGTWYEVARLDHRFERNLENVTATYVLNDNGSVKVINKGYNTEKAEWKEAIGKAKLAGETGEGYFKVSFFGPFYGPYIIYELERENYDYAFVTSGENYLWLLSRSPVISPALKDQFIKQAKNLGYDVEALIFVDHSER